jgi:hypothetical protein
MTPDETAVALLREIDRYGCESFHGQRRCSDPGSGRVRGSDEGATAWCHPCLAHMALSALLGAPALPDERDWFVSYDLTARSIVLQYGGDDKHQITPDEARALSEELFAATVAENEHRVLYGSSGTSANQ